MPGFLPWMSTTALKNVLILPQKVQFISQHYKNAFKQGKFFMQLYHQLEEIEIFFLKSHRTDSDTQLWAVWCLLNQNWLQPHRWAKLK